MKRSLSLVLAILAIGVALLIGIFIGDKRNSAELWRDLVNGRAFTAHDPNDPALQASLPVPDPAAGLTPSPLDALLKPDLTPEQQTDVIGQTLLDYWATTRALPNGTWEEVCAQLAGRNPQQHTLVPAGHPALGKDSFISAKDKPGIRLHVVSSSGAAFQLIHDGPDGKPYTDDDLIRNFPPDLDFR